MYKIKIIQETTVRKKCGPEWKAVDQKKDEDSGEMKNVYYS